MFRFTLLLRHGLRITPRDTQQGTRFSSSHTKTIFSDASSAELIGEARNVDVGLPDLHGLPEDVHTRSLSLASHYVGQFTGRTLTLSHLVVTPPGRANAGKSSLLNAVLGRDSLVETSSKAGRTRTLRFYRVGSPPGSLVLVDAPGYGARGRPEWGQLFEHYLNTRKELKRVYILFNAKHGLNEYDQTMLQDLDQRCQSSLGQKFTLQAIITKLDLLLTLDSKTAKDQLKKIRQDIFEAAPTCLPSIMTSTALHPFVGIHEMRQSVAEACGVGRVRSTILHNQ
ncbi:P-loop containing nucleoside triphosphate hydrolase protein [Cristinia sonorae]|uniref:P-loop containing nucleoside triphosphate hydrolase protein n=1 Tax=Cristinia sonorae TaxID=1940300 RepID=A0A8K0UTK4_9AGAR|nr:P-loop containing nucleoside triphosphate hydrolase protein [Cristinia sonorae]